MWDYSGNYLSMAEHDFGNDLTIKVKDVTFENGDTLVFDIKTQMNGETILTKTFTSIINNSVVLNLTEEDSAKLPIGTYVYSLDIFRDGVRLCNIIPVGLFRVVDKA